MVRVKVFIDAQNLYRDARRAFFSNFDSGTKGQVSPRRFGELLVALRKEPPDRQLAQVRVYTGRPNSTRDPKTYGAHMRQSARWSRDKDVLVIARSLRYPRNWPDERPQEKGIDVQLAVDLVRGYVADEFDIGIVASTDTDLVPAVEALFELDKHRGYDPVEVSVWHEGANPKQLRVAGKVLYCHDLALNLYNRAADPTDYNVR